MADGVTPTARARELERELRLMGPDQPAGARGVRRAAGAPHVPPGAARRREVRPAATSSKVIKAIDAEIVAGVRRRLRRRVAELRGAVPDAVPGRPGSAAPHRTRRPARDRHRGGGQAVGQERAQAVAALGRRALAHRAGVPVRRVPQPAVALLRDGRGRGRPRRRQPPPLPRPRARVPPGGAAAHREPPEAHDGGGRRALRRHDAARRQQSKVVSEKVTTPSPDRPAAAVEPVASRQRRPPSYAARRHGTRAPRHPRRARAGRRRPGRHPPPARRHASSRRAAAEPVEAPPDAPTVGGAARSSRGAGRRRGTAESSRSPTGHAPVPRSARQGPQHPVGLHGLGPVPREGRPGDVGRPRGGADPRRRRRHRDHRHPRPPPRHGRRRGHHGSRPTCSRRSRRS